MSDKSAVQWIQDSSGVNTCHVNDGSLDFKQSLIGTLFYRGSSWYVVLADGKEIKQDDGLGFGSMQQALRALETHYFDKKNYGALPPPDKTHEIGMSPAEIKASRMKPRQAQKGYSTEELLELKRKNWDQ